MHAVVLFPRLPEVAAHGLVEVAAVVAAEQVAAATAGDVALEQAELAIADGAALSQAKTGEA